VSAFVSAVRVVRLMKTTYRQNDNPEPRENKIIDNTNAPEGCAEDIEEGLTNFVGDWDRADFISSLVFVGLLGTVVIFAALELVG